MIKAGIIGGAGYTGGETIRILLDHPDVELVYVQSTSNGGNPLWKVHADLIGETDMLFSPDWHGDIDVMFLCVGHGDARKFLEANDVPANVGIIDLSQDFRLEAGAKFGGREFVYGLTEMNADKIAKAKNIANPGCFATCIQLGLLPLAAAGALKNEIHVTATTGSTGAGQRPTGTTHFSWRANNLSVYNAFTHRHLNEIGESIRGLMPSFTSDINFIPYRGDFTRGIFASIYTECDLTQDEAVKLYKEYYKGSPFTVVSDESINLKQVVNTNKCLVNVTKHGNKLLITSAIDNLLKGAGGQAVENMNVMFGLDRKAGLRLKGTAF